MAEHRIDKIKNDRLEKLKKLRDLGINPYPSKVKGERHEVNVALKSLGKEIGVVGRILGWRGHGNVVFADLKDESGTIQLWFQKNNLKENFKILKLFDIGDFMYAKGKVVKTKAGELSVDVTDFQLLTKSMLPLPSTFYGLKEVEERYRKRYLDLILNEGIRERFKIRSKVVSAMREYLNNKDFLEVETPTLQPVYGGGFAKPFSTHHNALDSDFYLRISDEMYLKRLIVGGFNKVYEITKVFRNEGIDFDHNPEFTMFEAMIAYEDYRYGMDLIEDIVVDSMEKVLGKTKVSYQGQELDFKKPWDKLRVVEAVKKYSGIDPLEWKTVEEAKKSVKAMEISKEKLDALKHMRKVGEVIAFAFEEMVEEKLIQPTIIYDYPVEVSPLAKKCEDPRFTQRFEMFAAGTEFGNNYTELNDPIDLKQRFIEEKEREKAGFDEAHQTDYDYLTAIEHGFPPTCGVAIGIDRLVMLFTDAPSLKEIILFPTLKPEHIVEKKKTQKVELKGEIGSFSAIFASEYPSASVGYALIEGVNIKKESKELEKEKKKLMEMYKDLNLEKISDYSEIKSYRQMYKKMGVDLGSRQPSPEALLRRIALGKSLYKVNTCVDSYNLVVMKNRVSLGAFDLDGMDLPFVLDVASGSEKINLLGKEGITKIKKDEVFYADQKGPYNLDYNYRDSERTKITEKTKKILINVDGIYEITPDKVSTVLNEAIEKITKYCGGKVIKKGLIKY